MAAWSRREWLQAALTAAADSSTAEWRPAFRLSPVAVALPDRARCHDADPATPAYASRLRLARIVAPAQYDLLTGRYGLLQAESHSVWDGPDSPALRLDAVGRDAARLAQLQERVFLARPAQRGPQLFSPTRAIAPARLPALVRTQIALLLKQEGRRREPKLRGSPAVSLLHLDPGGVSPVVWTHAVWRGRFAVQASIASPQLPGLDSIWSGPPDELPLPCECFSCGGVLLLAVRLVRTAETSYVVWSRAASRWQPISL